MIAKIILVAGLKGSGKDYYTANKLKENVNMIHFKFAFPIRRIVGKIIFKNLIIEK